MWNCCRYPASVSQQGIFGTAAWYTAPQVIRHTAHSLLWERTEASKWKFCSAISLCTALCRWKQQQVCTRWCVRRGGSVSEFQQSREKSESNYAYGKGQFVLFAFAATIWQPLMNVEKTGETRKQLKALWRQVLSRQSLLRCNFFSVRSLDARPNSQFEGKNSLLTRDVTAGSAVQNSF